VPRGQHFHPPLKSQSRRREFLNKTLLITRKTHTANLLSHIACNIYINIYIDYPCASSGSDMAEAETSIYIYYVLKINSTKSFTTTIMKRHRVLYRREEETVYV
jgi:hypothetical protein